MKFIYFSLLFLGAIPAHSASIAGDMKEIGSIVKKLSIDVSDSSKNPTSAASAKRLVGLFADCQGKIPDSISQLPPDQQAQAMADYNAILQQEVDLASDLESAFLKNNNQSAASILREMQPPKSEGHKKYK